MAKKPVTAKEEVPGFHQSIAEASEESKIFIEKAVDIQIRIHQILEKKRWQQKDLAFNMKKAEAEISKLLSGVHNHTIRSLAKLEAALGEPVLQITSDPPQHDNTYYKRATPNYSFQQRNKDIHILPKKRTLKVNFKKNHNPQTSAL